MGKRLPHDASNWGSNGGAMKKHARSGTPHNHRVTIELNREAAREMERQAEIRKKQSGKLYPSVQDLFKNER
jgi:hypothetical protein